MNKSYLYVSIAILFFAALPTISKLFFAGVGPWEIMGFSCIPAALLFFVLTWRNGKLKELKTFGVGALIAMTLVGLVGVLIYNVFFQIGVARLPAQQAFVINYLWPALIILWARLLSREKITTGKWCAVLLSFVGVIIVAIDGDVSKLAGSNLAGVLACLGAAVSYSFYSAMGKKLNVDTELMLLMTFIISIPCCFLLAATTGTIHPLTLHVTVGYLLYGLLPTGIAYLMWLQALKLGNTAVISNLAYLTPVVSLGMTHVILGEPITIWSAGGLGIILLGILLQILLSRGEEA